MKNRPRLFSEENAKNIFTKLPNGDKLKKMLRLYVEDTLTWDQFRKDSTVINLVSTQMSNGTSVLRVALTSALKSKEEFLNSEANNYTKYLEELYFNNTLTKSKIKLKFYSGMNTVPRGMSKNELILEMKEKYKIQSYILENLYDESKFIYSFMFNISFGLDLHVLDNDTLECVSCFNIAIPGEDAMSFIYDYGTFETDLTESIDTDYNYGDLDDYVY